jgi:hypothetical protein
VRARFSSLHSDAHTLLIVVQATLSDKPAYMAACLAGDVLPSLNNVTHKKTSSTNFGSKFILSNAPFIAIAPNFGAGNGNPHKTPMGVLTAETITTLLFMIYIMLVYVANLIFLNKSILI